ncbi:hypothetical protein K458DRAFT_414535 [Lentithecium fluviatile CBS 122367]|uniref:Uncharacterized protein n=1 Tax=Lentithecium fluviatile CBS 122367 TaxID=1168545 RepID=A0A6G1JFB8_9PLEO|nr:hypothetical protein K458DRAFT_414535 [Lentithecium fluviatile CBS 122367]
MSVELSYQQYGNSQFQSKQTSAYLSGPDMQAHNPAAAASRLRISNPSIACGTVSRTHKVSAMSDTLSQSMLLGTPAQASTLYLRGTGTSRYLCTSTSTDPRRPKPQLTYLPPDPHPPAAPRLRPSKLRTRLRVVAALFREFPLLTAFRHRSRREPPSYPRPPQMLRNLDTDDPSDARNASDSQPQAL